VQRGTPGVLRRAQTAGDDASWWMTGIPPSRGCSRDAAQRNTKRATGTAASGHVSVWQQTQCVPRCPLGVDVLGTHEHSLPVVYIHLVRGRANCIMASPLPAPRRKQYFMEHLTPGCARDLLIARSVSAQIFTLLNTDRLCS
jgi:hypothetical protein